MKHDPNLFDHYFPTAIRVVGAEPSSLSQSPEYIAMRAAQLALAALDVREKLMANGSIAFADQVPAQSYPRATASMGTGISVQVHAPGGGAAPAGPTPPAPAAPAPYAAPPPPYAPPAGPPNIGQPYAQQPVGGGAMPPGIGVTTRGPDGQ